MAFFISPGMEFNSIWRHMMAMMISSLIGTNRFHNPSISILSIRVYRGDVEHLALGFWVVMSSIKVLAHIPSFIDILAPACLAIRPYVRTE